ncbi:MAG: ABC transporter ATP-binding protein [Corynebacteriales bacterium]|nr:ABC transporter ATP-binding protein [Mycobacteriales bacterium]
MGIFELAGICLTMGIPLLVQRLIDGPLKDGDFSGIVWLSLLMLAFALVDTVATAYVRWQQGHVGAGIEYDLRQDFYQHLLSLPAGFHSQRHSGELVTRFTDDIKSIRRFGNFGAVFFLVNSASYLVMIGVLLYLYWPLGLLVAVGLAPLLWFCYRFESRYGELEDEHQEQTEQLTSQVEESVTGVTLIKAFGQAGNRAKRFAATTGQLRRISIKQAKLIGGVLAAISLVPNLVLLAVLIAGAYAVAHDAITVGTLVAFTMLTLSFNWLLEVLGWILQLAREAATSSARLEQVFAVQASVRDGEQELTAVRGELRFDNVRFAYPDAHESVLRGVNLRIAPGETVALVGAPGSGKTTLTALVPRFFDVTGGSITIDGQDIRELTLSSLRRHVACTFEEPTLFSASIRENVTLGRPDATDDEIAEALATARVDFVESLEFGLDTRIGEQGIALSGGQRQRLALARAVLAKPRILVLDDPLSALDVHTEAAVEKALRSVLGGVTALLVARRPSTVALADRVALLHEGVIIAHGTHKELLATNAAYRNAMTTDAHLAPDQEPLEVK